MIKGDSDEESKSDYHKFKLEFELDAESSTNELLELWNHVESVHNKYGIIQNNTNLKELEEEKWLVFTGTISKGITKEFENDVFSLIEKGDLVYLFCINLELRDSNGKLTYQREYDSFTEDLSKLLSTYL